MTKSSDRAALGASRKLSRGVEPLLSLSLSLSLVLFLFSSLHSRAVIIVILLYDPIYRYARYVIRSSEWILIGRASSSNKYLWICPFFRVLCSMLMLDARRWRCGRSRLNKLLNLRKKGRIRGRFTNANFFMSLKSILKCAGRNGLVCENFTTFPIKKFRESDRRRVTNFFLTTKKRRIITSIITKQVIRIAVNELSYSKGQLVNYTLSRDGENFLHSLWFKLLEKNKRSYISLSSF